jgi:hypothetical protein
MFLSAFSGKALTEQPLFFMPLMFILKPLSNAQMPAACPSVILSQHVTKFVILRWPQNALIFVIN